MFSPILLVGVLGGYLLLLAALAVWAERRGPIAERLADSRFVYGLGVTVYCTAWTYYGSVGVAARSGFLFLAVFLGPTLVWLLGWTLIRRLARFRAAHGASNLGDLLAARYGHSGGLAALATVLALVAINPYIALQFKAVLTSFELMVHDELARHWPSTGWVLEILLVGFVMALTMLFGLRHLDPGQRQRGVMVVLAAESLVKLAAFAAVGVFVTWGMYDGLDDLFARVATLPAESGLRHDGGADWYLTFLNWMILSMAAVLFLPRQFHVTFVELPRARHLRTAMWFFPLYLLAINFFVYPIAAGGVLAGHPTANADSFVLGLPLQHGNPALALFVFLGGVSAAVGMIMVSALTLSVMAANNLVMPLADRVPALHGLRRRMLGVRWAVVGVIIVAGYLFSRSVGASQFLASMGLIAFAGVAQFAPAVLGGLLWPQASRTGALWGLSAGFVLWAYTLFLPAVVKSGALPAELLAAGPFGIAALRPESLLGTGGLDPLAHGVFWSLFVNVVLFVLGSCWRPASDAEREAAAAGDSGCPAALGSALPRTIPLAPKLAAVREVLRAYLPAAELDAVVSRAVAPLGSDALPSKISPLELVCVLAGAEKALAGAIGAASAHVAMRSAALVSARESQEVSQVYGRILAKLKLSPEELRRRVDFHQERQRILEEHATELADKLEALRREMSARGEAEAALRESEARFRSLADSAPVMIWMSETNGDRVYFNQAWLAFTGRGLARELGGGWLQGMAEEDREAWRAAVAAAEGEACPYRVEYRLRRGDGEWCWVVEQGSPRMSAGGALVGFVGSCVDVSDMKAAAETLRRSRDELEQLVAERTAELRAEVEQRRQAEASLTASNAELTAINEKLAEAQSQLLQSEKMASIGQLAAGVAHEINNPIGFVNSNLTTLWGYVEDLMRLLERYQAAESGLPDPGLQASLQALRDEIELDFLRQDLPTLRHETMDGIARVRRIVKDLKDFSHVDESTWQEADLHAGLDSTLNVVWNELKYKASVDKRYGELPLVRCIPSQTNQVFMNLLVNAAQAIDGRGVITIRTGRDDQWVWIEIEDTGRGIPPEHLGRVFEPFFTTKPVGHGTGLGLSVSYGIVKKHGGRIEVRSMPGEGACFRIRLPLAPVEAPDASDAQPA